MLNTSSLHAVNSSKFSQGFVKPLYSSYCFSNIPHTIEFLLTGEGQCALPPDVFGNLPTKYSKVILFFIDAFGWRFFERYAEKYQFLQTIHENGIVSKLTSQFPSTTAAHVTCMHTGLDVAQSGVYEWNYYEPLVNEVISPLLFSYAGDKERDTLKLSSVPADAFYPRQTLYPALKSRGVPSYIFQSSAYTPSTYSNIIYRGATVVPFKTLAEAIALLAELLFSERAASAYYFLYFDKIDAYGHVYGPNTKHFEEAVDIFLTSMERLFYKPLNGKVSNTLFIMTADHGQIEVDPRTTFYLNLHAAHIERYLRTNSRGKPLVPAGSARDMFLYIKDEYLEEAVASLQKQLAGRAEVYQTQELLAQHFFGLQPPSPEFLGRLGNVVILPYPNESVWWYEEGKFDMHFLGHHGGLLPEEMEIPLLLLPL
jgi:predicted AlkP superfamily pyrophosphatase or phosphodiesterase